MTPEQIETSVDAAAATLQLPLSEAHRPGVLQYFALAARMADLVAAQPLGITDDPAQTFIPISPMDIGAA